MKYQKMNFYINATIGGVPVDIICGKTKADVVSQIYELNEQAKNREQISINKIFYISFSGARISYAAESTPDGDVKIAKKKR